MFYHYLFHRNDLVRFSSFSFKGEKICQGEKSLRCDLGYLLQLNLYLLTVGAAEAASSAAPELCREKAAVEDAVQGETEPGLEAQWLVFILI